MAEADLTCSICLDTFSEPVVLGCHHSFCRTCLLKTWAQQKTKSCPMCRRKSSKDELGVNFSLKTKSDSLRQAQESQESTAQTQERRGRQRRRDKWRGQWAWSWQEQLGQQDQEQQWSVCPLHPLVPPLFCLDEARGVCAVCEFSEHKEHTVVSEEEAKKRLTEQIQSKIQTLKEQRRSGKQLEKTYEKIQRHSEEQVVHCERQITAVFEKMRRHLQEEQDRAVSALRVEKRRQIQAMDQQLQKLRETLSSLNSNIQELEEQLKTHTYCPLTSIPQPLPQPLTGLLLDQAKVLGNLGYRVWSGLRRKEEVQFSPVILDPNTAARSLHLSTDLSRVTNGDTYQHQLPENPERFSEHATVLGSEGFRSGTHQWDVEVGDHPDWTIGVAKESVDRKGDICASPEYGIWCLWHGDGKYTNGCDKPVTVQKPPEKIRVKLDCNEGKVSFYDAGHMTHLYTHTGSFNFQKMFPYFSLGQSEEAKTTELRVCVTSGPQ